MAEKRSSRMAFKQITIIGTGLIGGSFGLAIKAAGFSGKVIGCDRHEVLETAKRRGAIDTAVADPVAACQGSDLILLAVPVLQIIKLLGDIAPHLTGDVLVTDVGSTKVAINEEAKRVFGTAAGVRFLAGHPMAGKEHGGIGEAEAGLFRGAAWIFVREKDETITGQAAEFSRLVESLGARTLTMEAREHDALCAWISHLPQVLATALSAALQEKFAESELPFSTGGRALREMTRIAASPYSMWRDIFASNPEAIREAVRGLEEQLAWMRAHLDDPKMAEQFATAQAFRKKAGE